MQCIRIVCSEVRSKRETLINSLYPAIGHNKNSLHLPFDVGKVVINKIETAKSNISKGSQETENRLHTLDAFSIRP